MLFTTIQYGREQNNMTTVTVVFWNCACALDTLVEGKRSHHYTIPAPLSFYMEFPPPPPPKFAFCLISVNLKSSPQTRSISSDGSILVTWYNDAQFNLKVIIIITTLVASLQI